nr:myomesin-3 [Paramormyrops kingsleyae]
MILNVRTKRSKSPGFTMATKTVTFRCREEEERQMSHSVDLSSQIKKKTFTSSDEEASYSEFYPIISADLMSVKELLNVGEFPRHRTWEVLKQTLDTDELRQRDKWTLFGNEAEKVEVEVIRNQHTVRKRADRLALRQEAERKASIHKKFLEDLSMRGPDFPIPLRNHAVWEGMAVKLSCTMQGCPSPQVTWYKDGVPLGQLHQPWNVKVQQTHGLNTLEIRRASVNDAGEYKAVARSPLGEAITFATLLVKSYKGGKTGLETSRSLRPAVEEEARIGLTFPPTFAIEGEALSLKCDFTSSLLASQQDVTWLKDGAPLRANSKVELQTALRSSSLTIRSIHKELEGIYTVRLRTCDGFEEHSAYVYVKDGVAATPGAPGSPMNVQCHDMNKDYILLTWTPPSADGACKIQGYYVEKCDIGVGDWVRCNETPQWACCYPIRGLLENTMYQFRVRALNQAGVGRPSKATEPVLTSDPAEPGRRMVFKVFDGKEMVITKDELEGEVRVPLPPTDVHACEASESFVVIGWTEPEPRGREPLTFYVERSVAGHDSWHLASLGQTVASPRFAIFDLQKGKSYCFRVRSINKYGVSDPSPPSELISLGQPVAPPCPPHGIQALRDTDTSVQLLWKEPKATEGILGYYLYYCEAGTENWRTVNNKPVTSSRFTIHGLTPDKMYVFRVKSVSRAGNSEYSEESTAARAKAALCVPSRPSAIVLLNCTGTEMVIGWRAPTSRDPVRGYYLDQTDTAAAVWREVNTQPVKERTYRVSGLQMGHRYRFRVFATNVVGLGPPSEPSDVFLCDPWTMDEPGCPYDLVFREVRITSLVLLWEGPMYEGRSQVTGYLVEINSQDEAEGWTRLTQDPIPDTHLKVSGLQAGKTYILRVSAVNKFGVGMPSLPSEPITAQTKPGTKDVEIGVDNDGFIFLGFECPLGTEASQLVWAKNYTEPIGGGRARVELKGNRSTITFLNPSEEDLGLYTVVKGDEQDISSSYNLTAEDLEKMQELSWQVRNPLIALKTPWTVDVSEQGSIRLWLQTEPLSEAAQLHLILNDREITSTPERKINFHKARGILEVLIDQLCPDDEGSYTAQLQDGRAKNQFTLVLVDEKFRQTLAQSDAKRKDWKRKSGPHFLEFLSWQVTKDCELIFRCQVTNVNRDTCLKWFKDGGEISNTTYDLKTGVSTYTVPQVTRKEMGVYRAVVSDGRGEDVSTLQLVDEEFEKLQQRLSKQCALSAGPLEIQCTAVGFRISCSLKHYLEYLKTSWFHREKRIDQDQRALPGSSMRKLWVEILGPTESDKGKYSLQMFDGAETHTRTLDLSGQAFEDAMLEHQRLKQVAIAEKSKWSSFHAAPHSPPLPCLQTLCLTCFVEGDPAPEMFWLKNDRELFSAGQYNISSDHQCTTLTINKVNMEDSGLYSIFARNKHGSQTVNVTVSVYKRGEKPRAGAVEM